MNMKKKIKELTSFKLQFCNITVYEFLHNFCKDYEKGAVL